MNSFPAQNAGDDSPLAFHSATRAAHISRFAIRGSLLRPVQADQPGSMQRILICTSQGIDVKPNGAGDATSRLIVTVLAAVAEFERDLIRERTALGLEKARAAGVRLGRRPKAAPAAAAVKALREAGRSWTAVGAALGIHPSHARRIVGSSGSR